MSSSTTVDPVVAVSLPQRQVQARAPTTLFHVAARTLGDATQWYRIAQLNGTGPDPWLSLSQLLFVPQPGTSNGGIPSS